MRQWVAVFLLTGLAACSWVESPPLLSNPLASNPPAARPFQEAVTNVIAAIKLAGPAEVSPLRKAPLIAPASWTACLRGTSGDAPPYALFFNGNSLIAYRVAVLIDNCARESYAPFTPATPAPTGAISAPGVPKPTR
ncbi:MAG: hypothetical protein ACRECO_18470 [Xanthobacteraceae bacterium]